MLRTRSLHISRFEFKYLPWLKAVLLEEWKAKAKGYGAYAVSTDLSF